VHRWIKFVLATGLMVAGISGARGASQPNIVLMLSDDQGWSGTSVLMHPSIVGSRGDSFHTPHLEKLASQGMRFSAGYAPAPVCSPTRISLQTGKSPAQLHWTKAAPPVEGQKLSEPRLIKDLSATEITIAELLKRAGYTTAHFGKWHIRGGGPGKHGYDEHDGDTGNEQAFQFKDPNPVDIFGMAQKARKFMEKAKSDGKPFFVQLSWNALHASENARKSTLAKYQSLGGKRASVAAITEDLDEGVGRVLQSIDELGLAGNTYVIYMSDNGAGGGAKALAGGKGDVYEGGIRVPFLVRGPGVAPNSWCHTRVVGYDLYPTFCEWAGLKSTDLPKGIEGGSIASLLKHQGKGEVVRPRKSLVFHFPHYQNGETPHSALINGDFKLVKHYETNKVELFDLGKDIRESKDLSNSNPEKTRELENELKEYLVTIKAQMPTPNASYDPKAAPSSQKKGGRGKDKGPSGMEKGAKKPKSTIPD